MLVLSRKVGQEIVIGDNIRVRVVSIQGNQIRLGFEAPRQVRIQRQELLESDATVVPDACVMATPSSSTC